MSERVYEQLKTRRVEKAEAEAAIRAHAFLAERDDPPIGVPEDAGRPIVHTRLGIFGCDWSLADALRAVDEAADLAWIPDLYKHDLAVVVRGVVLRFAVPHPDREFLD